MLTERGDERCVCVVGMMSQEFAQAQGGDREACDRELRSWTEQVARLLAEAKAVHEPAGEFDPVTVAWYLNRLWQGSMLVAKTHEDPAMIRSNLKIARAYLDDLFSE